MASFTNEDGTPYITWTFSEYSALRRELINRMVSHIWIQRKVEDTQYNIDEKDWGAEALKLTRNSDAFTEMYRSTATRPPRKLDPFLFASVDMYGFVLFINGLNAYSPCMPKFTPGNCVDIAESLLVLNLKTTDYPHPSPIITELYTIFRARIIKDACGCFVKI